MKTSSKGASEKRRLTQYVTNTVLDNNFKGTTEQFVLHFNEQFRQLEEISEVDERLPPSVKLTLLQTAVRSINDLRIVETLDEFQSTTHGHGSSTSLSYDTYYDLLINACVRYDKTKKANIGKRRNVYATNIDDTYVDLPTACIEDVPDSPYGGIDLPPDEFYQVHALSCPQDSTMTPERSINHHFTYHVAQASQAKHGSLVDRGANGGLARSDVRILSRSDRIPSTTPGAEPPRGTKDSGSARSHSTHLVTSSQKRP